MCQFLLRPPLYSLKMLITAPQAFFSPSELRRPVPKQQVINDTYTPASRSLGADSRWQIARIRQKLPTELPQTNFSHIEKLLKSKASPEVTEAVKKAYEVAEAAHAQDTRQDGTPYIHHPARVCAFLISECDVTQPEVLQAALLHDVVEDTPTTIQDIEANFGKKTAEYVDWLTKPSQEGFGSKQELNAHQAGRIKRAPKEVRMIKLADRMDNISDLHLLPPNGKMERYVKDTRENYLDLAAQTDLKIYGKMQLRVTQLEQLAHLRAA